MAFCGSSPTAIARWSWLLGDASPLSEQSFGSRPNPLVSDFRERRRVDALDCLVGSTRWSAQPLERLEVVGVDGPHETKLGSIKSLPQKQTAHIRLRRAKVGGGFGDRKEAWTSFDRRILARTRNHFWCSNDCSWTEARCGNPPGAGHRWQVPSWHVEIHRS